MKSLKRNPESKMKLHRLEMSIDRDFTIEQVESLKDAIWDTIMSHSKQHDLQIDSDEIDLAVLDAPGK